MITKTMEPELKTLKQIVTSITKLEEDINWMPSFISADFILATLVELYGPIIYDL